MPLSSSSITLLQIVKLPFKGSVLVRHLDVPFGELEIPARFSARLDQVQSAVSPGVFREGRWQDKPTEVKLSQFAGEKLSALLRAGLTLR